MGVRASSNTGLSLSNKEGCGSRYWMLCCGAVDRLPGVEQVVYAAVDQSYTVDHTLAAVDPPVLRFGEVIQSLNGYLVPTPVRGLVVGAKKSVISENTSGQ